MRKCISSLFNYNQFFHSFVSKRNVTSSRIRDLLKYKPLGDYNKIKGWVRAHRKMKDIAFVDVNDGSCSEGLQVIIPKSLQPQNLSFGSSVEVHGTLTINPNEQIEMVAKDIKVVGPCVVSEGYPFAARKVYPPDYVRQFPHLRPRTKQFGSLLRVRDAAFRAICELLHAQGFVNVHTPLLTSNDCEGAGEVFLVQPDSEGLKKEMAKDGKCPEEAYFDSKAFLTVSGQLHLEAVARGLSKVYTFGPTFRAENSRTRHHLSEFYMLELEMAFLENLSDLSTFIETFVKGVTSKVLEECEVDVQTLLQQQVSKEGEHFTLSELTQRPFVTVSYDEAVSILERHSEQLESRVCRGEDLSKVHELFLVKHCGGGPVFVVEWPRKIKPFYMKCVAGDTDKVAALDLLVPRVGELCGGSLREDNYTVLQQKLESSNLDESLAWYLELRKYGNIPTGGFGLGFERYLQYILGIQNIKDTIPFPRWPHNCKL
uniref:asparagine--tRNA ligase n=1 Tax=Timema shepardi TaxID=629360 RepID=A0A7R9G0W3_TIMSH|nr:unnamed protein product [Timema shepardi]